MTQKREPTEAEAKALEAVMRHARGLALALESYAKALLGSRIDDRDQDAGTPTASPKF